MSKNLVVGFPRIGEQRELKKSLELFWSDKSSFNEVEKTALELKKRHWLYQKDAGIDYISSNDFSLYDNMLDMSILLGAIPRRFNGLEDEKLYFSMARGDNDNVAMEMTKWFNTNYHYIVPELSILDEYKLNSKKIISEYKEAKRVGIKTKINIIGLITFLGLSKRVDSGETYDLFYKLLPIYEELLIEISKLDDEVIVQIDEPIFVKDIDSKTLSLIKPCYDKLSNISSNIKIIVTTYFEHSNEATKILVHTPIWAIGLDFLYGKKNFEILNIIKNSDKKLIAGIVDGRNIWKNNIDNSIDILDKISQTIDKENIIISTSCSLLHTPFTLKYEEAMNSEIKNWLSYGVEKLEELSIISKIFFEGLNSLSLDEKNIYSLNKESNKSRKNSKLINNQEVQERVTNISKYQRIGLYEERIKIQKEFLKYGELATTTIGSFPQTAELRKCRLDYKKGLISFS